MVEYIKLKELEDEDIYLHKIQTCNVQGHYLDQYRPHLNFPHLHDHGGHHYMMMEYIKFQHDTTYLCDICFSIPRFFQGI